MTAIKICGITQVEQAAAIAPLVDFIGLNLWPRSKRYVTVEQARVLAEAARVTQIVGLFVDATLAEIEAAHAIVRFDVIQLHGRESTELAHAIAARIPVWKALAATPEVAITGWPGPVLLDTPSVGHGGSGKTFDWTIAQRAIRSSPEIPIVLAGGLDPDNVAGAIAAVAPWAVDTASGVESSPGVKDLGRVRAFVDAVRRVT